MEQSKEELIGLVEQLLDKAKSQGATSAEADVGTGIGFTVTTRIKEVEKIEHERDKALSVTVYFDKRKGSASTSDFSKDAIDKTIRAACDIACNANKDDFAGLAPAEYLTKEIPDLDLHHPWEISPEYTIDLAITCEHAAIESDPRISNSDGTSVSTYSGIHVYGNTNGFANGWEWSSHMIDCAMIANDGKSMQRDGWYSKARDHLELQDIKAIGKEAARRTTDRLGARKIPTCKVPVIFEAPVASGLFSAFITAISGASLYRRATFLLDKLNQPVFAEHVHIREQPHIKKALGSAPFDNDGVATRDRHIVNNGVLQGYILSAYSARKLSMQPTGNAGGVHNLIIEHGDSSLEDLLKKMDTGLLITDVIGFGVNQVTGDFSRGISGFWVEHGVIQYPVEEITAAGNLKNMYMDIIEIGKDVDIRGNILTGSVLIDGMMVAGN